MQLVKILNMNYFIKNVKVYLALIETLMWLQQRHLHLIVGQQVHELLSH